MSEIDDRVRDLRAASMALQRTLERDLRELDGDRDRLETLLASLGAAVELSKDTHTDIVNVVRQVAPMADKAGTPRIMIAQLVRVSRPTIYTMLPRKCV
jgi:hypothetical protein